MDTKKKRTKITSVYITEGNLKFLNKHKVRKYSRLFNDYVSALIDNEKVNKRNVKQIMKGYR